MLFGVADDDGATDDTDEGGAALCAIPVVPCDAQEDCQQDGPDDADGTEDDTGYG